MQRTTHGACPILRSNYSLAPLCQFLPFFIWFVTSLLNSSVDTVKKVSLVLLLSLPYSQGCQGYHREGIKKVRGNTTQKRQVERKMHPLWPANIPQIVRGYLSGNFLSTRYIRQKIKFTVDLLFNDDDFLFASLFLFLATHRTSVNQLGFFFCSNKPHNQQSIMSKHAHENTKFVCICTQG